MTTVNVLIVFASTGGDTESLALAAGVGAIQARANIRLRRLPPGPSVEAGALSRDQRENFERMSRDYIAPRADDPLWANVIILATSIDHARQVEAYVDALPSQGQVAGKIAAPLAVGDSGLLRPIFAAAANAGLIVVPPPAALDSIDERHAAGRRLVAFARAVTATPAP